MGYFIFNGTDSREFGILESVPIPLRLKEHCRQLK